MTKAQTDAGNRSAAGGAPEAAPGRCQSRWTWLAAAAVVAAACAAYGNSFSGAFVYDDFASIRDNVYIRRLWPLHEAMSIPKADGGETVARRPLLSLTFALNYAVSQYDTWSYHAVNLAIHACSALLLLGIVRRTLCLASMPPTWQERSLSFALAVALIWTVHPLQTESVTYIVQRAESLMGMFYLLTLYASLRAFESRRPLFWMMSAVIACALGMAVKEVMITAPLMVLLYDGTFVSPSYWAAWRKRRRFYLALAGTSAIFIFMVVVVGGAGASDDFVKRNPLTYALTQPGVLLYYLRLTVVPYPQALDYNWPLAKTVWAIVPPGIVVLLLLGTTAWGLWRRRWFGFLGRGSF